MQNRVSLSTQYFTHGGVISSDLMPSKSKTPRLTDWNVVSFLLSPFIGTFKVSLVLFALILLSYNNYMKILNYKLKLN